MIQVLGKVTIQDLPQFISVFATRGAAARRRHGSRRAQMFHVADPQPGSDADHVVVLFTWESREAFQVFLDDPKVREVMKEAGIIGMPEFTILDEVGKFPA